MMAKIFATMTVLAFVCCPAIRAAAADAPGPATAAPNLDVAQSPGDGARYDEYFYFHKSDVAYTQALADIQECDSYSHEIEPMTNVPDFVPMGGYANPEATSQKALVNAWFMWGPIGMGIVAGAMEDMRSGIQHTNLRRCMQWHGYQRYGTSKSALSQLGETGAAQTESKLAAAASGPAPQSKALEP